MKAQKEKKVFEITANSAVMRRFERFLSMLHYNSGWGHSALFAMPLDGDGNERFTVSPKPDYSEDVELTAGIGGDVEIAYDNSYTVKRLSSMKSSWVVKYGGLHRNGVLVKGKKSGRKQND